jgi:hypothetical protein
MRNTPAEKRAAFLLALLSASILLYAMLLPEAKADFKLLELHELSMGYKQFGPGGSDPLLTQNGLGHDQDKEIELLMNTSLLKFIYWNNRVHAGTDKDIDGHGQFRTVGWQFQFGVHLSSYLDVQYEHHSQHVLDYTEPFHFPVQDSIGIRIYFYRDQKPVSTILP